MFLTVAYETLFALYPHPPKKLSSGGVHGISMYPVLDYIYLMLCIASFKPERVTILLKRILGVNLHLKLRLVLGLRGRAAL